MSKDFGQSCADSVYVGLPRNQLELKHYYGNNVHIVSDPFCLTHLAYLCEEKTTQPAINTLVSDLYQFLIHAVLNGEFPLVLKSFRTRMAAVSPQGVWTGQVIDRETKTVTVNILRAGSLPSQVCFDYLTKTLNPQLVRQDHVVMARKLNDQDQVIGSHLGDSKIGGDIDDAIVIFPDPMGATGSSVSTVIDYYKNTVAGKARKIVAVHLIVTPEYIRKMQHDHPDVRIYAIRLDRGASSPEVLKTALGEQWEQEKGLTDRQYIVPGGGGFGEIINNAYC